MLEIGTPFSDSAKKVLMLGCGELGKEVVIELQRYGIYVVAVDRYDNAPAMQVAHASYTIDMLDAHALREVIAQEEPDLIVPEIEAIATSLLVELEGEGYKVIPTANATSLTMNREGIRRLAAEDLKVKTSSYLFADRKEEYLKAVDAVGIPCVVKPVMSSSGKGQSLVKDRSDVEAAWDYAQQGGRAGAGRIIVEGFVQFDYEITLLTIRHKDEAGKIVTSFCDPIGHIQVDGDYRESWQPQAMSAKALAASRDIAGKVTGALGGLGLFGVELFVKGDSVYFSEVSPRPHDTGMVTMISQDLSEFALHVRAILGLPIPDIRQHGPSASAVILVEGDSRSITYSGLEKALATTDTQLRLFGKPEVHGKRRMGVTLARGASVDEAREKARSAAACVTTTLK